MDDAFQANSASQRRLDRQGLLWAECVLNGAVAALQGHQLACDGKRGDTVEEVHLARNPVPEVELVPFDQSVHRGTGFEGKRENGPGVAAKTRTEESRVGTTSVHTCRYRWTTDN